jgi:hypothetical protein
MRGSLAAAQAGPVCLSASGTIVRNNKAKGFLKSDTMLDEENRSGVIFAGS